MIFPSLSGINGWITLGHSGYGEPGSGGFVDDTAAGERRAKLCRSVPRLGAVTVVERLELAALSTG